MTRPVDTGGSYRLAVSAEMVFVDLPFEERVRRIADHGFEVEIWDWTKKDIDSLAKTGATFSSMTGYVTGTLADPDGAEELLRTAEQSLRVAEELDCPRLNVHGTGLDDKGLPVIPSAVVTPSMWLTAAKTLTRLAELGERAGRVFTLENLNTAVDHPASRSPRPRTPSPSSRPSTIRTCGSTSTSTTPRSARETWSSSSNAPCPTLARSRSPTSPVAANPAPARSTTRPWPPPSSGSATPASSASRAGPRATPNSPSKDFTRHSPSISRSRAELVCPQSWTQGGVNVARCLGDGYQPIPAILSCASTRWRVRPRPVPESRSEVEPDAPHHGTSRAIHSDTIRDCAGGGRS